MFPNLFSPIQICNLEIRNRINYPALALLYSFDRKLNDRYINFFRERAKGGAGIVTVGPVGIDFIGSGYGLLAIDSDEYIKSFSILTSAIKNEGARAWIQLYHAGAYALPVMTGKKQAIAPSAVFSAYSRETPREMTIGEIKNVQEAFIKAGERAKEAGFDGVELIGSAGYLITQFLSPLRNRRTDEYGGSFENRTRFPREIIERMRTRLGSDYPITIRMAGNDFVPGSNTDLETPGIARVYEKAGISAINVTGGWHESRVPQLPMELPRAGFSYLAQNIRNAVSVPVMSSNRITDPCSAEQILVDGMADIICLGRVLLADPCWPKKAMEGKVNEIRPCISCNQGCMDEIFSGKPVFCIANCEAGFEEVRHIKKSSFPRKVMVIGAGPGGLEAAVRAAEAGHDVTLYEKTGRIGGQLWIAGTPPYKNELWELVRYYEAMLGKYRIDVRLGTEADTDLIISEKPDFIITAEGAEPLTLSIDGTDNPLVYNAWDVLANDPKLGKKIAVIGGGSVGLETAHFLGMKGTISPETLYFLFKYRAEPVERLRELITGGNKEITVFEMTMKAGEGLGKSSKWILMANIDLHNIKIMYNARVTSLKNGLVTFTQMGKEKSMQFDNIVTAIGSKPVRKIADSLKNLGIPYKIIGDSAEIGRINNAIHEGYLAVMDIE